ncbi:MAG TPA: hypothetical protein VMF10_11560 [Candidatus Aquilonibacter sp.]|nr:hypothetical protein [Candidatus Aquilonibacter sp.]
MKVLLRKTSIRISTCKVLGLILAWSFYCSAQNPQLQTKNGLAFATVVFTHSFATETPRFYSVAIDSTGSATYQSAPTSLEQTGVPYTLEFTASPPVRDKVFRIVGALRFFRPPVLGLQQPVQSESANTLTFREGNLNPADINNDNVITFHSSKNPGVQQLTDLFESISETLEFGRQLTYLREQRSPGINMELRQMQDLARRGRLSEVLVVAPVLKEIASDTTIDKTARTRASAILKYAQANNE